MLLPTAFLGTNSEGSQAIVGGASVRDLACKSFLSLVFACLFAIPSQGQALD